MLILSQEVFHARIFQSLVVLLESSGKAANCGLSISELFVRCSPGTSLLKILTSLEIKDWNISYMTFPKSGMMCNGNVYQLDSLDTPIIEKDFLSLPTPLKSDGDKSGQYKSSEKLLIYLKDHTDRLFYQCRLNGLNGTQIAMMYEWVMGLPIGWTEIESPQLEMQLS